VPTTGQFQLLAQGNPTDAAVNGQTVADEAPAAREILFIDPAVPDFATLADGVRAVVRPVLLDARRDALEQIADALERGAGYDTVHVVTHGAPGRLEFSSGALSHAKLFHHAGALARIRAALAPDGELLLWACAAGQGAAGRLLIDALAEATGANVAAASHDIGDAARGASWTLDAAHAPLAAVPFTRETIANYRGLLIVGPLTPVDGDAAANTILEGAANGTAVDHLSISASGAVSYALTDNAGGRFQIDSSTGVVTVLDGTLLDFETATSHSITVEASDGVGGTGTQSFTIDVSNANPSTPTDGDAAANTILEGAAAGTAVAHLAISSSDPNGPAVTYALTDNAGGRFQIDSSSGAVTVLDGTLLDFETATSHSITVEASDGQGGTSSQSFTIDVSNANPATPVDGDAAANTIVEGAAAGTAVAHLAISSSDPNGPAVTYALTDSAGGFFTIDAATGVVSVDTAGASGINYETAPGHAYSITVQISDGAGGTSTQSFSIDVTDVAPSATADVYNGPNSVDEDQALNITAAAGVLANDSDVNGGPLTAVLDLGPAHAASFTLNPDGSFSYTPSADYNGPDGFTYHAFDGAQSSGTVAVGLTVNAVNDAPAFTNLGEGAHPQFTENGASVVLDNNVTVSDVELNAAGNYGGATLTLSRNGGADPDDTFAGTGTLDLAGSNGLGENVSLDGGGTFIGTFTQPGDGSFSIQFNASATAADVASVMQQIVYSNASDNPANAAQIDWTFSDGNTGAQGSGGAGVATGSVTVDITQVDDAPVLLDVALSSAYVPGSSGVVLSPALDVFDADATAPSPNVGLASATVKISAGFFAGDELFVNLASSGGHFVTPDGDTTNISVQSNALGMLVLSGQDTVSHYQSILDAVSYHSTAADPSNGGADPNRTITWQVNDGVLSSATPGPDFNETILHFDLAPAIDLDSGSAGTGFTASYTENAAPIAIVGADTVTDSDNANMDAATIVLTNAKAGDSLSIAGFLPGGIDGSIDTSVAGQITVHLANSASTADYQTALAQIRFSSSSEKPDTTDRDISFVTNDGDADSNLAHATVHVIAVNDAPVAASGSAGGNEDTTILGTVSASDVDNTASQLSYALVGANGGAGHGTVVLHADGTFSYTPVPNFNGNDSFSFKASDGALDSNVATESLTINAVNDAPVNTVPGPLSVQSSLNAAIVGLAVNDIDAGSLTTSLHVDHGTLTVASVGGAAVAGSGTGTVTLTGSAAQIDASLAAANNVVYQSTFNFTGTDHLTMTSNDGGGTGSGGPLTDIDVVDISVDTSFAPPHLASSDFHLT
jgi:hypothetical protein